MDAAQLVAGSFLDGAPVVEVSAVTKVGLPELMQHLETMVSRESGRDRQGVMRMPVDRSFAVKGFGAVATGTLLSGCVSVGETLELLPQKVKVRVRGLQSQHTAVQQVSAGQRVAVNLANVEHRAIKRGQVLATPDLIAASRLLDVQLHWLDMDAPPAAKELFVVHLGTAESSVKISIYRNGLARLRLTDDLVALPGDRFVLRRPSPAQTVAAVLCWMLFRHDV